MKRYQQLKESFTSELYKEMLKEVLKYLPKEAFKGISTYNSKLGSRNNFEVTIPKNNIFTKGLYVHVGSAEDKYEAMSKALESISRRFEEPEEYGTIEDLIKSGSI
jgi:diaminopimelate decarboxylase